MVRLTLLQTSSQVGGAPGFLGVSGLAVDRKRAIREAVQDVFSKRRFTRTATSGLLSRSCHKHRFLDLFFRILQVHQRFIGARRGVQLLGVWMTNLPSQLGQLCDFEGDQANAHTHKPTNKPTIKPTKCSVCRSAPSEHLIKANPQTSYFQRSSQKVNNIFQMQNPP